MIIAIGSKAAPGTVPGIQLGSVQNELALDEQKFAPLADEVLSSTEFGQMMHILVRHS